MTAGTLAPADMIRRSMYNKWWEDKKKLMLVRNSVCAKANNLQFDEFVHICQHHGLDPLLKQIYCFVFSKGKPDERMVAVVAIGGYRAIAERTGNYMMAEKEPRIVTRKELIDVKERRPKNPAGLVSATVWVKKRDSDKNWHTFSARAKWSEYAPFLPLMFQDDERGSFVGYNDVYLDPKSVWFRKPEFMLEKCAEALALRRGWPEDYANLYAMEEVDGRAFNAQYSKTVDLTPSEYARVAQQELADRVDGVKAGIVVIWEANEPMVSVPISEFDARVMEFIDRHRAEPQKIIDMHARNMIAFREYFRHDKAKCLELKRALMAVQEQVSGKKNYFIDKAPDRRAMAANAPSQAPQGRAAGGTARATSQNRITSGRELHALAGQDVGRFDEDDVWPPPNG